MDSKEALLHFQRLKEKADNQAVQFEKLFHQRSNHRKDAELFEMAIKAIKFKEYFGEMYGKGLDVANWHLNGQLEPFDNFCESACE
jgi:hypothetical protein